MEPSIIKLFIPVIAIVMGISLGGVVIFLNYRKRKDMFVLFHQERMAAIEKGIELPPLPPEFFSEDGKVRSPHARLLTGLVWLFIGLGLMVDLYFEKSTELAGFGLVPTAIGLAYLIYYFAVGKKEAETIEAERRARAGATSRPPTA